MTKILVTGSAGFIGYSLSTKLLERGDQIIDSLLAWMNMNITKDNLKELAENHEYHKVEKGKVCGLCYYKMQISIDKTIEKIKNSATPR